MGKPKTSHSASHPKRGFQLPADALLDRPTPRSRGSYTLEPQNHAQRRAIATINAHQLTFLDGPAGTGKTHITTAMGALALHNGLVDKIIVTRPNLEVGNPMGFLPGEMDEKFAPFFRPVRRILEKVLGAGFVEYATQGENPKIEIAPVPYLRGATFERAWVVLDEGQNMTPKEMELFLTRVDDDSKVIVDGDAERQCDLAPGQLSGLTDAMARLRDNPRVGFHTFTIDDIVRGGLCRDVILAYRRNVPANDTGFTPPPFLAHSAA